MGHTFHIIFWTFAALYFSWCLQLIARKTETSKDWLAWVPVINIFYMVQVARLPMWWALLLFVPVVNLYALYVIWGDIAKLRNRPAWVAVFMLIPVLNYMTMTNLALKDRTA